jgi:predicted transcriptional regulator of viral defense system
MKHLERPYYLGLLTAAQFYGAAHHAPQETYVITTRPTMRPIQKKGIKINFISVNNIRDEFTETRNTPTGTVHISSPVLTAIDLVDFDNKIGRISRVATVLNELAESMKPEDFNDRVLDFAKVSTLQRLGYLFENSIDQKELADSLFDKMAQKGIKLHKTRLHSRGKSNGFAVDERWQVIVNAIIEIDE